MLFIWVSMYLALQYSNWRRDRHFTWLSEPHEGPAACIAKTVVPSFLSYFKTLSIGPTLEIAVFSHFGGWGKFISTRMIFFVAETKN